MANKHTPFAYAPKARPKASFWDGILQVFLMSLITCSIVFGGIVALALSNSPT